MQKDNLLIGAIDQGTSSSRFLVHNLNFLINKYFFVTQLFKGFFSERFPINNLPSSSY